MSESKISPEDPRLTAYALGELTGEDAAIVAAAIAQDPALEAEVAAIRAMGTDLESALAAEPLPATEPVEWGKRIEFPRKQRGWQRASYYWVSGLAAAGFAVLMLVQSPESPMVGSQEVVGAEQGQRPAAEPAARVAPEAAEIVAESASAQPEVDASLLESAAGPSAVGFSSPTPKIPANALAGTEGGPPRKAKPSSLSGLDSAQPRSLRLAVPSSMAMPEASVVEGYAAQRERGWQQVANAPLSTFAVDVDSASYANVRRFLRDGDLPPLDAVKVEELVNAFPYDYAAPRADGNTVLQANLEVAAAPWAPQHRLVRVGLKAPEMTGDERAAANLVFLLDVSGSMDRPNKLPLVKEAMRLLVGQLKSGDRVAIVTYAGQSGLALPSTPVSRAGEIRAALDQLSPGGSTHGSSGIHLAYDVAKANFVEGGVNRVILCTDGDFNVGTTGLGELERLIAAEAESGVFLTALGFGTGDYRDETLELLANRGNGTHGYIDSVREARRWLVEQVNGALATVAQDVKIQVEFNPLQVAAYRLLGYNNRRLAPEDFNDDAVDAGEIGAGHTVTALYEIVPTGEALPAAPGSVDALRYQTVREMGLPTGNAHELLTVKVRAQPPGGGGSRLSVFPLVDGGASFAQASPDFKFAAAVAAFGLKLRDMPAAGQFGYPELVQWARSGIGEDPGGYRSEFVELVDRAAALQGR
jgi:Ca-activated chloride channel homolog